MPKQSAHSKIMKENKQMKYLMLIAFLMIACEEADDYYVIGTPDPCQADEDCIHRPAECSDSSTLITYFDGRCEDHNCIFQYDEEICEGFCRKQEGWDPNTGENVDDICDQVE